MAETPGQRLYLIRLACGDGIRRAESLDDFSARIKRASGEVYDPATLSRLERGVQQWKLSDVETLARLDPLRRGRAWLATFDVSDEVPSRASPERLAEADAIIAEAEASAKKAREKRHRRARGA